jgi:hypothetical protein
MRFKFLKLLFGLTVVLLFSGMAPSRQYPATQDKKASILSAETVPATDYRIDSTQIQAKVDPYYKIEINEEPIYNNALTRKLLSGFKNKNLRAALIGWNAYLPKPLDEYYTLIVEKAFRFPIVFFFLAIIFALAMNVIMVIAILFFTNRVMNYRKREDKRLRVYFEKIITDLMLQVTDTEQTINRLSHPYLAENYNLLIEVLMDFQKSFRGDSDRLILELYQAMELGRISYNKTFAISFYEQVKGIRELANMHPYHAIEMIASRLNDPNDIVRTEAQISYPHVNRESPFDFMNILEKPFSRWAQLNIYYFIKIHEMPVPSFDRWLTSSHPSVVNFSILMIALFQQHENSPQVIMMLQSVNEETRNQAIKTCGELRIIESKEMLKSIFPSETVNNQLEITKVFLPIGDETDITFLAGIARSEIIPLRLEACRTLYNLNEAGQSSLEELNALMNFALEPFIEHIKDPRN